MSTTAIKSARLVSKMSDTKDRILPTSCQHCHHLTNNPPAWMRLLAAMAGGAGRSEPQLTIGKIAEITKQSRALVVYQVDAALLAGMLELVPGISGARVYRRTWYGRQILGRWKSAGWRP